MKITKKTIVFIALCSAATAVCCYVDKIYSRKLYKKQLGDYIMAISATLDNIDVTDFESFSDYLFEYYGIIAKKSYGDVVEYSSDKYNLIVTSDDIVIDGKSKFAYNMNDLEVFFFSNRRLWGNEGVS